MAPKKKNLNQVGPARSSNAVAAAGKKPRTEAQRAAARRNGSKGRGPVSAAGKARSRLNAVKHGLLAKAITPPSDLRGEDTLYRSSRASLLAEFGGGGTAAELATCLVASDLVHLARVRLMREALMRPRPGAALEKKAQQSVADARRAAAVQSCRAALSACPDPLAATVVTQAMAELVADALDDLLAGVQLDEETDAEEAREAAGQAAEDALAAADAGAEEAPVRDGPRGEGAATPRAAGAGVGAVASGAGGGFARPPAAEDDDPFELQWAAERKSACDALAPIRAELADRAGVIARLTGRRELSAADRPAWVAALDHLARDPNSRMRRKQAEETSEAYHRAVDHHLHTMVGTLPTLETLQRYERRLLRDIDRRLAALARG